MKVYIGKHVNWFGPYQLAEKLMFWESKYDENYELNDNVHKFGEYLSELWGGKLSKFLEWVHSKKKRKVNVRIDPYDVWNVDSTLSYIIHPIMIKLRDTKNGTALISKEDVPEHLHSTYHRDYETHPEYSEEAYIWVLNEIIWAFDPDWSETNGYYENNSDMTGLGKRQQKAYELFGKYYSTFWD